MKTRTQDDRDEDDALRPFIGIVSGVLVSFVMWALLGIAVVAAHQLMPSWVAATVQTVLLAAR